MRTIQKKEKKTVFTKLSPLLRGVVPVLCMLQDIETRTPKEIGDKVSMMTDPAVWELLNKRELTYLRRWLRKNMFDDFTRGPMPRVRRPPK